MNKELETQINRYKEIRKKIVAYYYVMNICSWDASTIAPYESYKERGENLSLLSEDLYKLRTGEEFTTLVNNLYANKESLEKDFAHEIEMMKEDIEQTKKIPMQEMLEYENLINEAQVVWEKAKNENDYDSFYPYLEKIILYKRKEAKYLETDTLKGYDVLLNQFERGFTQKEYDKFFNELKEELVPFIKKITDKKIKRLDLSKYEYPIEKQKEIANYIAKVMCFDFKRGAMAETEHPYTWNTSTNDVRVTNHYYLHEFSFSLFSAIHELGHATYEQQISPKYDQTFLSGGVSMAVHESQSRFYENVIGRDFNFWRNHFPEIKHVYKEQFKNVSLHDFYQYINHVEMSFVRTEADELTYPLHIMIRYELERDLINGTLEPKDLRDAWNEKTKEYLGLDVPTDTLGILQDSHWAGGAIGYFPTYALGSAIASQIYDKMNEDFNVTDSLDSKTTKQINEWLKEHIHKYGSSMYPKDILKQALKEDFDASHYINYLKQKYALIYDI